jgi:indole-3-glycerol phosphate synthase
MNGSSYLHRILERKREDVAQRKTGRPLEMLRDMPGYALARRSLLHALESKEPAVIAEIKRASPSKGVIRKDADPACIALAYARAGAAAISVLTDEPFFNGSVDFLMPARGGHELPVLRKDFIIDSYQLHEARAFGADAVLLIVAALDRVHLSELFHEATALGLEVLVEVHDGKELEAIEGVPVRILGINNRNLSTFETTLDVSCVLAPGVPAGTVVVSESGIHDASDVRRLASFGVHAMLIGETFMRAADPGEALRELLAGCRAGGR